jgi:hypothetical protein
MCLGLVTDFYETGVNDLPFEATHIPYFLIPYNQL